MIVSRIAFFWKESTAGTKAEVVIAVIERIPRYKRLQVDEITLDLSSSMMLIARTVFPKTRITNDRFHVQKLYYDAIDELRVSLRWMARDRENEEMRQCREAGTKYVSFKYANGGYPQVAADKVV